MVLRFHARLLRCVAAVALLTPAALSFQSSGAGTISGIVYSSTTKDSIPLATVVILGSTLGAATNDKGVFTIRQVPPGTYEVQASAVGYAPSIQRDVVVRPSEAAKVTFALAEQSIQVGEVLVTGKQILIPELPVSTQYLSYREIQNTAGAFDDIIRNVATLPGVTQTRPDRNDLIVRGGAATENLFLVDNLEVPNIDHFGTEGSGAGSVSFINLEFVENTAFSAGGFGVRYGDKLSSVMSIGIRDPRTDENHVKATVSATEAGLNLEGPVAAGGGYLFSVRRSYLDPVFKYYGFAFAPYYWDFLGKATYRIGTDDNVEVLGTGAIDKVRFFNDTQAERNLNARELFSTQNEGIGGATWRHGFGNGYSLTTLRTSYSDFNYHQNGDAHNPYVSNMSIERETSLREDVDLHVMNSTDISFGVEGRVARLHSAMNLQAIETGFTQEPKTVAVDFSRDTSAHKGAAYAQVSQRVGAMTLTLGVRGDYFDLITDSFAAGPRFSASYALSSVTKITGSVGKYLQAPSYIWVVGNPLNLNKDLTYLKMNQYVVGIEHYLQSDLKISLEAYLKEYYDYPASVTRQYLVMVNTGTELRDVADAYTSFGLDWLESGGTGFAEGIDLYIEKRLSETPFYGRLTLSYGESMFKALDGVSRPSNNDQRWKLNIGCGYIINDRWEATSTFRFYTGIPYTPYTEGTFNRLVSDYNSARVGVNHSLDLRVARRWNFHASALSVYLDIQNVYNRKTLEPPSWNQADSRPEQPPSLGIVPSLGVSVEF
ncbi:MAG TPA: TonB-dependent receptor [Bacteroidota bacterium]|nr:TonB-dependent receptor [Bacteroidota bacterium]